MNNRFLPPSPPKSPKPESLDKRNPVLLESFEWHSPADFKHWCRLRRALPALSAIGVTSLWLPPGCKAKDSESNGYDLYDAYDLGEFEQKGTTPTKWGTKNELQDLAIGCRELGMGLIWDAILNHRAFADATETVTVVEVDPRDRRIDVTPPFEIEAWTKFNFAARNGKYSSFKYNKSHFNGTDWNQRTGKRAIYRFVEDSKNWQQDVGTMQGNADYLMLENLDYTNEEVVQETMHWGEWMLDTLAGGLQGFRLDAVQHYSWRFADRWSNYLRQANGGDLLCIGEFWHGDVKVILEWMDKMSPEFRLYDVPLMYKIARLSWGEDTDLRQVFRDTLVEARPDNAVTFIRNHDTQRGQDMDNPIRDSFTPHAHALLLLRRDGCPCIFFGDLYGTTGPFPEPPTSCGKLPGIILARKLYAYGPQVDYFERSDCIGWARLGHAEQPDGCVVIISWTREESHEHKTPHLDMNVGKQHAGEVWTDVLGFEWSAVCISSEGVGRFPCQRNSMACFVRDGAEGREQFPVRFDADFYGLVL